MLGHRTARIDTVELHAEAPQPRDVLEHLLRTFVQRAVVVLGVAQRQRAVALVLPARTLGTEALRRIEGEIGRLLDLQWLPGPEGMAAPAQEPQTAPITRPPREELQTLYRLAQMGDMSGIRAQAEHLETLGPAYRPLARRLLALVERFQSAAILQLVERLRNDAAADLERAEGK